MLVLLLNFDKMGCVRPGCYLASIKSVSVSLSEKFKIDQKAA